MSPSAKDIYPSSNPEYIQFPSRRSVVHSTEGIVSCTQPLAAQAGRRILAEGGNAADAAVAVAAALNVTEPGMTGIGGDMFCLFYNASTKKVHALNGSGRSPANISIDGMRKDLGMKKGKVGRIPMLSVHSVTVPGAAAGWVDTVEKFGSGMSLEQVLMPAIELGERGYPVSQISSQGWQGSEENIRAASRNFKEILKSDPKSKDGVRAPFPGEIFKNPNLAKTFRTLAKEGKKGFYEGRIGNEIIKIVQSLGGHHSLDDLRHHAETGSQEVDPISLKFNGQGVGKDAEDSGVEVWEHPPNGQGIVALMALGILEELERTGKIPKFTVKDHNTTPYLHALIESLSIAFSDANWWVTDPDVEKVPSKELISRTYLAQRAKLFSSKKASGLLDHGEPSPAQNGSDTVYFAVTDKHGNGISFINSNYGGFGTCIVPAGCGFTLQNRGSNFILQEGHPNCLAPRKRPYHTIIPALITNPSDNSLHTVYGVMGGFMQPQGHVQVLMNMLVFKCDPQAALDAPRICIGPGTPTPKGGKALDMTVHLEDGISETVVEELQAMGHEVKFVKGWNRSIFGRGQVVRCHWDENRLVYSAGSDPRGDGCAVPA